MSIRTQQIVAKLNLIDRTVSQVRHLLSCPEGVRIVAVWRDNLSYVEYWDGDMPPRILFLMEEKVEEEFIHQFLFDAVSTLPPSYCDTKPIEIYTDIKTLSEGINIAINVFQIKVHDMNDELLNNIKERYDFNDYLSRVRETQASPSESA